MSPWGQEVLAHCGPFCKVWETVLPSKLVQVLAEFNPRCFWTDAPMSQLAAR